MRFLRLLNSDTDDHHDHDAIDVAFDSYENKSGQNNDDDNNDVVLVIIQKRY